MEKTTARAELVTPQFAVTEEGTIQTTKDGGSEMKARILLSVVMVTVLPLVLCAFAQGARRDPGDLARFQKALERDGFDVTPGEVSIWNPTAAWCENQSGVDNGSYTNKGRYLMLHVPKSVEDPQPIQDFQIRH